MMMYSLFIDLQHKEAWLPLNNKAAAWLPHSKVRCLR
jgi:hypothetical protein